MRSTSTDTSEVSSPPVPVPAGAVPTLEALQQMTSVPDQRVVFRDVDWAFYEQLVDSIPEWCNIHVDYDGKDLEIMGNGPLHEAIKKLLGYLVWEITTELETSCKSLGETAWKWPKSGDSSAIRSSSSGWGTTGHTTPSRSARSC